MEFDQQSGGYVIDASTVLSRPPRFLDEFGDVGVVTMVASLVLCVATWLWWFTYWSQRNSPGPREWPVVGLLPSVSFHWHRLHDFMTDYLYNAHTIRVHIGCGFVGVFTVDPANIEHIMKTNFSNYPKVRLQLDFETSV